MTTTELCDACRAGDCDNCEHPNPYGRADRVGGWFPACCCGRITMGPTSARGRAALVRARRETPEPDPPAPALTDAQLDGRACVHCGRSYADSPGVPAVPVVGDDGEQMRGPGGSQLFRCADGCEPVAQEIRTDDTETAIRDLLDPIGVAERAVTDIVIAAVRPPQRRHLLTMLTRATRRTEP